eukprot:gene23410-biopygen22309
MCGRRAAGSLRHVWEAGRRTFEACWRRGTPAGSPELPGARGVHAHVSKGNGSEILALSCGTGNMPPKRTGAPQVGVPGVGRFFPLKLWDHNRTGDLIPGFAKRKYGSNQHPLVTQMRRSGEPLEIIKKIRVHLTPIVSTSLLERSGSGLPKTKRRAGPRPAPPYEHRLVSAGGNKNASLRRSRGATGGPLLLPAGRCCKSCGGVLLTDVWKRGVCGGSAGAGGWGGAGKCQEHWCGGAESVTGGCGSGGAGSVREGDIQHLPGVTGQARTTPAPCPRHARATQAKTNAYSPRHARPMPAPRPRQCPVTPVLPLLGQVCVRYDQPAAQRVDQLKRLERLGGRGRRWNDGRTAAFQRASRRGANCRERSWLAVMLLPQVPMFWRHRRRKPDVVLYLPARARFFECCRAHRNAQASDTYDGSSIPLRCRPTAAPTA